MLLTSLFSLTSCGDKPQIQNPKERVEIEQTWNLGVGQVNGNLSFGEVSSNSSKILTVLVKNIGDSSIGGEVTLSDATFSIIYTNSCSSILPGKSCMMKLLFVSSGKTPGPYTSSLNIGQESAEISAVVLPQVEGNNIAIKVNSAVVSNEISFGNFNYRQSVIKTLTIANNSNSPTTISSQLPSSNFTPVFDNCSGKKLAAKSSCVVKFLISGQGKDGEVVENIEIAGKPIALKASVQPRGESIESNSNLIAVVDNQEILHNQSIDLGTINTGTLLSKNIFLENKGYDQTPVLTASLSAIVAESDMCSGRYLTSGQSCRIISFLPTQAKGAQQVQVSVEGYLENKNFNIEYIVRSPGDKIDCSNGLDHVATAEITWTGLAYSSCEVLSCDEDFHIDNNLCVPDTLSLTMTQPLPNRGIISGPSSVVYNGSAVFTYTPPSVGYVLNAWSNNCVASGNTCTLNNVTTPQNVSVTTKCASDYTEVGGTCLRTITLNPTSQANYNIFTAAGSPTDKVVVNLNVNAGTTLYSSNTSLPALNTGSGWVSGSVLNLNNNGQILGMGGAGGIGGANNYIGTFNTNGLPGGPALVLNHPITITNNGSIFSGGGGGGGSTSWDLVNTLSCGGGGGGGQGYGTSAGGALGTCWSGAHYPQGGPGSAGNISNPGNGGAGRTYCTGYGCTVNETGGRGGTWGQPGDVGGKSYVSANPSNFRYGTAGGSPGNAITTNGHAVNWISGNDSTRVKGPVQ